jgi:hypothetical protein
MNIHGLKKQIEQTKEIIKRENKRKNFENVRRCMRKINRLKEEIEKIRKEKNDRKRR